MYKESFTRVEGGTCSKFHFDFSHNNMISCQKLRLQIAAKMSDGVTITLIALKRASTCVRGTVSI